MSDEKDYQKDGGFLSRKFIISIIVILAIIVCGILWGVYGWEIGVFSTICSSLITIAIGYAGISSARVALPKTAEKLKREQQTKPHLVKAEEKGNEEGI